MEYLAGIYKDSKRIKNDNKMFRVLGLAAKEKDKKIHIFVSYNYWHPDKLGKTTRVARLIVDNISDIFEGKQKVDADEWEIIYESQPLMKYSNLASNERRAFTSNRSGGRLVFDSDNSLIVGFGDQDLDGRTDTVDAAQDNNSSYGKLFRIDLRTLDARIFVNDIRNPQGLHVDRDGNIWETEHGPQGGDELNLIHDSKNYGWALVTYGTEYGTYEWLRSENQGRHKGFELPTFAWVPSIGISNLIQVNDTPEQWDGDLLVSSLRRGTLFRMRIRDKRVIFVEPIKVGERIRDLVQMSDGTILLWTDNAHFIELTVQEQPIDTSLPLTNAEINIGLEEVIQGCLECHRFKGLSSKDVLSLQVVYNRRIADTTFTEYSDSLKKINGVWNEKTLKAYLTDPQQFAPGTTMPAPSIDSTEQLDALILYLKKINN